jgi:hypothetical protein
MNHIDSFSLLSAYLHSTVVYKCNSHMESEIQMRTHPGDMVKFEEKARGFEYT